MLYINLLGIKLTEIVQTMLFQVTKYLKLFNQKEGNITKYQTKLPDFTNFR